MTIFVPAKVTIIAYLVRKRITHIIDFFYPPFRKLIPVQLFRYLTCGGVNVVFDWVLYFVFYHFVFQKQVVFMGSNLAISPHIAAFVFTFPIVLLSGFYLSHSISFHGSILRRRVQLLRYCMIVGVNLFINYICLKLFVDVLCFFPTPAKMITTVFTTTFGYFAQKHFSFKRKKE